MRKTRKASSIRRKHIPTHQERNRPLISIQQTHFQTPSPTRKQEEKQVHRIAILRTARKISRARHPQRLDDPHPTAHIRIQRATKILARCTRLLARQLKVIQPIVERTRNHILRHRIRKNTHTSRQPTRSILHQRRRRAKTTKTLRTIVGKKTRMRTDHANETGTVRTKVKIHQVYTQRGNRADVLRRPHATKLYQQILIHVYNALSSCKDKAFPRITQAHEPFSAQRRGYDGRLLLFFCPSGCPETQFLLISARRGAPKHSFGDDFPFRRPTTSSFRGIFDFPRGWKCRKWAILTFQGVGNAENE